MCSTENFKMMKRLSSLTVLLIAVHSALAVSQQQQNQNSTSNIATIWKSEPIFGARRQSEASISSSSSGADHANLNWPTTNAPSVEPPSLRETQRLQASANDMIVRDSNKQPVYLSTLPLSASASDYRKLMLALSMPSGKRRFDDVQALTAASTNDFFSDNNYIGADYKQPQASRRQRAKRRRAKQQQLEAVEAGKGPGRLRVQANRRQSSAQVDRRSSRASRRRPMPPARPELALDKILDNGGADYSDDQDSADSDAGADADADGDASSDGEAAVTNNRRASRDTFFDDESTYTNQYGNGGRYNGYSGASASRDGRLAAPRSGGTGAANAIDADGDADYDDASEIRSDEADSETKAGDEGLGDEPMAVAGPKGTRYKAGDLDVAAAAGMSLDARAVAAAAAAAAATAQASKAPVPRGDLAAAAGHHSHGHHYYQHVEVPKKKAWKFGFKRGNHKHEIERHEKGYKHKFHSHFKWHATEKCKKKKKCKSIGEMKWEYKHDKKHH